MIKHLITGGCSFSHCIPNGIESWPGYITRYLKNKNPKLTYKHTGYPSQGQELIQKKVMLEIIESLERGTRPEDIQVIVMWSGTHRKAWWIDNKNIINEIVKLMSNNLINRRVSEFLSLKDGFTESASFKMANGKQYQYSSTGGWYFTVDGSECDAEFIKQYYMFDNTPIGIGKTTISLENIIMLQNFCKLNNIKLIQQFYMDTVLEDIEQYKDHLNINYLYKQLDFNTVIKNGIFNYLQKFLPTVDASIAFDNKKGYFMDDRTHPGPLGVAAWCNNVLLPFLESK